MDYWLLLLLILWAHCAHTAQQTYVQTYVDRSVVIVKLRQMFRQRQAQGKVTALNTERSLEVTKRSSN